VLYFEKILIFTQTRWTKFIKLKTREFWSLGELF